MRATSSLRRIASPLFWSLLATAPDLACSPENGNGGPETTNKGGSAGLGGNSQTAGQPTGGTPPTTTGGTFSTGGVPTTGGALSTGGASTSGGTLSTGGAPGTSGTFATGGQPASTGGTSTGGTTGTGTGGMSGNAGRGGQSAGGMGGAPAGSGGTAGRAAGGSSGSAGKSAGGSGGAAGSVAGGASNTAACKMVQTQYAAELEKNLGCNPKSGSQCTNKVAVAPGCECRVFMQPIDPFSIEGLSNLADGWFTYDCSMPTCPAKCTTATVGTCQADSKSSLGGRCITP